MKNKDDQPERAAKLRRKAEKLARSKVVPLSEDLESLSPEKAQKLLYELQVHQIELEMQNDELRRATAELEAARVRYFELYDLAPVGYVTINEKGLILEANLAAATLWGVERSILINQPLSNFILSEDQDLYYLHRKQLFEIDGPQECELRMNNKKGETFWTKMETKSAQNIDGLLISLMVISDITERKQMEKDLKLSAERYRSLIETQTDLVSRFTPDGTFIFVNEAYCHFFNKSIDEWVGKKWQPLPVDEDVNSVEEKLLTLSPTNPTVIIENRVRSGQGNIHWMQFVNKGFFDPQGKLVEIQSVGRDITERKRIDEALRKTERQYRELVDNANSVIIRWNRDGIITFFNEYGLVFFGYRIEEIIGKHIDLLVPAQDSAGGDLGSLIQDIVNHPERFVNNINENVCRDGRRAWMAWTNKPIFDENGQVVELLTVGADITSLKRAEEAVLKLNAELEQRVNERTAQLEAANKELESFSYSVSHDLRAPLRGIDGFSLALLEDYAVKLDDTGKGYIERIRKATQKMGFLIDDLLKLSRVTRYERNDETIDLSRMIRTIAENLRQNQPDRSVEMIIPEGLTVQADPYLMQIALNNLLDNAWKFTAQTGKARIEFGLSVMDGKPGYFIKDNGVGFDMTYVNKLFNPFQRLHATQEFSGTGIGLATVKQIITRHGGQIWAEGKVGKGAVFHFTLPGKG
jgi:PAS domain S-box-containing protein